MFSTRTGTVLAFDDGYDGVTLVDLDRSRAVRRVLDGQRAGDQPYRLIRAGDAFIVGWSGVYAAPLDGSPSRQLDSATIAFPAAEPGAVWLDTAGYRLNDHTPTFDLVDTSGKVLLSAGPAPTKIDALQSSPGIGVSGGIAFETTAGVRVWYPATQKVQVLGAAAGLVGDVRGRLLSWCMDPCIRLHVTRLASRDRVVTSPRAMSFDIRHSRFSPDGRWLAVTAREPESAGRETSNVLLLVDARTGKRRVVVRDLADFLPYIGWSADSRQLFFSSWSHMEPSTDVGRVDIRSGKVQRSTLPFGQALAFVTLNQREARALMNAPSAPQRSCPPPAVQPSGRTSACAFTFDSKRSTTG